MPDADSFPTLMRKLTAGDADAEKDLWERYARRLIGLAQKHIEECVRSKVDSDDIAQSVFRTFFRRVRQGQFDLANEDALWALLAEITARKCGKWNRYFNSRKRSSAREVPVGATHAPKALEPGPEEGVIVTELVE